MSYDTIVIGGGAVGMAVGYGLCRLGERVLILDEGDVAFRASRGNFGLVWVQGKGLGKPAYARWSIEAAAAWPRFAQQLRESSDVDVDLSQPGGLYFALDEKELEARAGVMRQVTREIGTSYPFEVLDARSLKRLVPSVGPDVAGAILGKLDGHVSPLKLLRALFCGYQRLGGKIESSGRVSGIECTNPGFRVRSSSLVYESAKVVLAAGLGNRTLAELVGLHAPVKPVRGQLLVTERLRPFLRHPTLHVRQTSEGVIQIGDSKEEVGFNDGTTLTELARIANRAARCFPQLESVNVVRTWGSLRVMSPDGLPIYDQSEVYPGAFVVTCHSGITLAPQHAGTLAQWIHGGAAPYAVSQFSSERFRVQTY